MAPEEEIADPHRQTDGALVPDLLRALGVMFDLGRPVAGTTLREVIRGRLLALPALGGDQTPSWGTPGGINEIARRTTEALEFFYRPHLFPGMDERLRLGHHLQFDLLPRDLPAGSPLALSAVLESYCHLSGDLLGWRMEGDELVVWIADISGHGVRAGLAAAVLYFLVADLEPGLPPAVAASRLNDRFLEARNPTDERALYTTCFWARFGPDGRGRYVSAGHPSMLIRRAGGGIEALESTGTPIGLPGLAGYEDREVVLAETDLLLLFTDGLVEATDRQGREVGSAWLEEALAESGGRLRDTTRAIYRGISERSNLKILEDDVTYLVATRSA